MVKQRLFVKHSVTKARNESKSTMSLFVRINE